MTAPRRLRLAAASALSAGSILGTGLEPNARATTWVLLGAPFLAAGLLWVRRLEAQLLGRAILWGYLFWATFGSLVMDGDPDTSRILLTVGLCAAGALVMLPEGGLEQPAVSGAFAPVAFRSVIVVVLILATTDAMVLGTNLLAVSENGRHVEPVVSAFFAAGSALMAVSIVGLLRMRTWGFLLNLLANVGVASFAWAIADVPWQLALGLTSTAGLQILLGLPLARRLARPGAGDPSPWYRRLAPFAIGALVLVLAAGRAARAT
ncbi:MAG TPA: hypothetical protein RMH99_27860 [Sandaracinaceae bacterium LLY-WYZ-13_1]|nr:hypothetical protein [Sandaracinaceae bacterium LLY-WYZ-13_1]